MLSVLVLGAGAPKPASEAVPRISGMLGVAGCQVVLGASQRTGDPTGLLFPFYFELDTTRVPETDSYRVLLPADDLKRWAGTWRWWIDGDSLYIEATAGEQAYYLAARLDGASWEGTLVATEGAPVASWDVRGRSEACPRGERADGR